MNEEISGLLPIPKKSRLQFSSAEGLVYVRYNYSYRCNLCAWSPPSDFGSIPALEKHLRDHHGINPEHPLWIAAYSDTDIRTMIAQKTVDTFPDA